MENFIGPLYYLSIFLVPVVGAILIVKFIFGDQLNFLSNFFLIIFFAWILFRILGFCLYHYLMNTTAGIDFTCKYLFPCQE